jgi:hypothetical protein
MMTDSTAPGRKRTYLVIQGLAILIWWVLLLNIESMRDAFALSGTQFTLLLAFFPADVIFVVGGSFITAWLWRKPQCPRLLWMTAGALWYATAYVLALRVAGVMDSLGAIMMTLASIGTAWTLVPERPERPA